MDLEALEKKTWQRFFNDGFWNILLGLLLLNFGLAPVIENISGIDYLYPYIIMLFAAEALFFVGKKLVTAPRIGRVKFSKKRKQKKLKVSIVLVISVVLGICVYALFALQLVSADISAYWWVALFCINAIVVFSVMAYFLDFKRLYFYGLFFGFSIIVAEFLRTILQHPYNALIGFGVFGSIMIVIGLVVLARFVKSYPLDGEVVYE